jgi:GH25 family lysozyme M1 (1,4-beta-N-acetylmuramidase)
VLVVGAIVATLLVAAPARAQTYMLGIDVSHFQGSIDWDQVADSGNVFVFQKATEGATHEFDDSTYETNRAGAAAASIPFGAYHFAFPQGDTLAAAQTDARSEAAHFLEVARPQPGDLRPVLDLEKTNGLPPQRLIAWAQAWLTAVEEALDVRPLIYTGPHFWETNLNNTTVFAEQGFPLWLAHYTNEPAPRTPAGNWAGNGWSFWQFTNCAEVPGIRGCVDKNRFAGSDLSPFIIPGAPEPEPTPDPATPPSAGTPPTVAGETEVGGTLTATSGTWGGSEPLSYSYGWSRCAADGIGCEPTNGTSPNYELVPADYGHHMKVTVTATNSAGQAEQDSALTGPVTDTTVPGTPRMTAPRRTVTMTRSTAVRWTDVEPGATYDVRSRNATSTSGFGDYIELATAHRRPSLRVGVGNGTKFCFSVRALDTAGNASGWSQDRCTTTPVDDRELVRRGSWTRSSDAPHYLGTLSTSTTTGATLLARGVRMRTIELVAVRCPGCGRVAVYLNSKRLATVSLRARRTQNKQLIHVIAFGSLRRGDVEIVALSSAPVAIDGLSLRR